MSGHVLTERVEQLITPTVEGMGFEIVRVLMTGGDRPTLQIMAEPSATRAMTVDDCADISRAVSAVLDVEDPIAGEYTLEVSSPGLDRPLVRLGDFDRFVGYEAKIEMKTVVDGRRRFTGCLRGTDGDVVEIDVGDERVRLDHADIAKAKLVVTDEMLAQLEEENAR